MLKGCLRSAAHAKVKKETTEEMQLGTLAHMALLEPESLSRCIAQPKFDRRTKEGKRDYAQFLASLPDKAIIVKQELLDTAMEMRDTAYANPTFAKLFDGGIAEMAGVFNDPSGNTFKIKPDYRHSSEIVLDLKTTADARINRFDRSILEHGYDLQAAFYLDVANLIEGRKTYVNFVWVVIETEAPYGISFYNASEQWLEIGRSKYKKALDVYLTAEQTGVWTGYPLEIIDAIPPAFAMYY